ncbi:hypothetical protein GCM10027269_38730 [Kribbella endophytica]
MAAGGDDEQGESGHVDSVYLNQVDAVYSSGKRDPTAVTLAAEPPAITLRVSPIETPGSTARRSCA